MKHCPKRWYRLFDVTSTLWPRENEPHGSSHEWNLLIANKCFMWVHHSVQINFLSPEPVENVFELILKKTTVGNIFREWMTCCGWYSSLMSTPNRTCWNLFLLINSRIVAELQLIFEFTNRRVLSEWIERHQTQFRWKHFHWWTSTECRDSSARPLFWTCDFSAVQI